MNKVKILLKQNSYLQENNEYDFYNTSNVAKINNAKVQIIILEEPLFIKIFEINRKVRKIADFIEEKIENIFPQNGDILYDYETMKAGKILSIYSIKGKKKVEKLISNAKDVQVVPVQFFLREVMIKKMKNKKVTCGVIFQIDKSYYFIYIKKGFIADNYITCNIEEIIDRIEEQKIEDEVYVDESINCESIFKSQIKIIKINIKDRIDEKIY